MIKHLQKLLRNTIEYTVDRYLTWKTKKTKKIRDYEKWKKETLFPSSSTVDEYFKNFKYVLTLSYGSVMTDYCPFFGNQPNAEFRTYLFPSREIGKHCEARVFRVSRYSDNRYHFDDMGGSDLLFVATNSTEDAVMLSLKYGSK